MSSSWDEQRGAGNLCPSLWCYQLEMLACCQIDYREAFVVREDSLGRPAFELELAVMTCRQAGRHQVRMIGLESVRGGGAWATTFEQQSPKCSQRFDGVMLPYGYLKSAGSSWVVSGAECCPAAHLSTSRCSSTTYPRHLNSVVHSITYSHTSAYVLPHLKMGPGRGSLRTVGVARPCNPREFGQCFKRDAPLCRSIGTLAYIEDHPDPGEHNGIWPNDQGEEKDAGKSGLPMTIPRENTTQCCSVNRKSISAAASNLLTSKEPHLWV
ncbi:hypothetical protein BD310DRAFT_592220 [Dichomitus squalens]|uniref:Uncharacterized protein n=1 Tax=Dichomitus squalens TaxID=114155 RepID=A0A4Q9PRC8_9APHY|nr:hypothetical protein BD310DRAFT_592220 [Dichomitus squalens]